MEAEFDKIINLIKNEYQTAIKCNGNKFNSLHEGYAVLLEEVEELWDEIKKKDRFRDYPNMIIESAQIASMAIKMIHTINENM